MELCHSNLHDWLFKRNKNLYLKHSDHGEELLCRIKGLDCMTFLTITFRIEWVENYSDHGEALHSTIVRKSCMPSE